MHRKTWQIALPIAIIGIIFDQVTKWAMLSQVFYMPFERLDGRLPYAPPIPVTDFFNWVTVWNFGVSFGLFQNDSNWGPWILSALAVTICVFIGFMLKKTHSKVGVVAVGMIWSGAIGNVIDRVRVGAVYDFIDFHYAGYHWPAFNVADVCITLGVVLFLFDDFFSQSKKNEIES